VSFGIGIIGCGMISRFHAAAIAELPSAELVACYNRTLPAAERLAEQYGGCRPYDDLPAMLADPRVDLVTICTPSGAHLEPAMAAIEAGKHVVIEKPLEVTVERCKRLLAAAERAGVRVATIFPSRFHRSAQLIKQAVDQGRFGQITMADAYVKWWRTQAYYDSGAWRGTWRLDGGGALMNQAIHSVDLLLWLAGPVVSVTAQTATLAHERIEVEDVAVATLQLANGGLGVIQASTATYPGSFKRIEIAGTRGTAILEEEDIVKWEFDQMTDADHQLVEQMRGATKTGGGAADPAAIGHHAHRDLLRDFLVALERGEPSQLEGTEGLRSVALIEAIYEAARQGRRVELA